MTPMARRAYSLMFSVLAIVFFGFVWPFDGGKPGVEVVKITINKETATGGECVHEVEGRLLAGTVSKATDGKWIQAEVATSAVASHPIIRKKVSEGDHDVVVWRIFSECTRPQAIYICATNVSPLVSCVGDPAASTVGTMFKLDGATGGKKVKSYILCTVDWMNHPPQNPTEKFGFEFHMADWGTTVKCPSITQSHEISIEIVP